MQCCRAIFVDIWYIYFVNLKGVSYFQKKTNILFLSKGFWKHPHNWVISCTLVIIINNVCVSQYACVAVTIFKWDTENIYISFTGT